MDWLILIGGDVEQCLAIREAHNMGYRVLCIDGNPNCPGKYIADRVARVSTYNAIGCLKAANDTGLAFRGVFTVAADVPLTVAKVAEGLGLRGISVGAAKNVSNKITMKDCFSSSKVPCPDYSLSQLGWEYPFVVKPISSRGARGVQIVKTHEQEKTAYEQASRYGDIMYEKYLPGPQLSVEGFMIDGEYWCPAIFDRNYEYLNTFAPFVVENGGEMPSVYEAEYRSEIEDVMAHAALSVGITDGIVKGDLVIHDGKVKVIEIAGRMSGGFFGTVAVPGSVRANLIRCVIQWATGQALNHTDSGPKQFTAIRFAFPAPGVVKSVTGMEMVDNHPDCLFAHCYVRSGETVYPYENHPCRPAVVVAKGDTLIGAVRNAQYLVNSIRIETK